MAVHNDAGRATKDVLNQRGVTFESLGLSVELMQGLREKHFYLPSPIQEQAIPEILAGRDVLARSKNGTGKTASFLIPMIQKINLELKHVQGIVVVPTRELATQICGVCCELAKFTNVKAYPLIGGLKMSEDLSAVNNGVHLLVVTPGRISEVCRKKIIDLSHVSCICIDEADVVLSNDQFEVVESLLKVVLHKPQLVLVSATFPRSIAAFKEKYMREAAEINTMREFALKEVSQFYAFVEESDKVACLYTLLTKLKINQCVVFCNSVNRVSLLAAKLTELGFKCAFIHSKMSQKDRNSVFGDFKAGKLPILVCSDIFNRGIDVKTVNVVVNFDLPTKSATYLHRIGRSGRFGRLGLGISFVSNYNTDDYLRICRELAASVNPIPKDANIDPRLYVF